ncbi:MAG: diguanylate cyclase [Pseudomonadaceae bacterium]
MDEAQAQYAADGYDSMDSDLADGSGVSVVMHLAPPYRLVEWGAALARTLGGDTARLIAEGVGLEQLVSPLSARRLDELCTHFSRGQEQQRQLTCLVRQRWILLSFASHCLTPDTVRVHLQDVSALMQEERAEHEAEQRLIAALETACVGVWEWFPGDSFISLCERSARWLGLDQHGAALALEDGLARVHPADRDALRAAVKRCLQTRSISELHQSEFRIKAADGKYRWVIAAAASVPASEQRELARLSGSLRDVTEHRQLEQLDVRQQELMSLAAEVQQAFLMDQSLVAACDRLFDPLLQITDSRLGFIGILRNTDEGDQYLEVPSISNISWDEASRAWYASHRAEGQSLRFHSLNNLFGHVVTHNTIVCTDTVSAHAASRGQPAGHPAIHNFLGIPLRFNGEAVGMIAMGNRDGGYGAEQIELLAPFATVLGTMIRARQLEEQRAQAEAALLREATHDALTGLANRKLFFSMADSLFEQAQRYGHKVVLAVMDIDFFKLVNDLHGHQMGDKVLQLFAETLNDALRQSDVPARVGGEEFAVLLTQTGEDEAFGALERFRAALEALSIPLPDGGLLQITVSIGCCDFFTDLQGADQWFNLADRALYNAKAQGRNRVVRWTAAVV